jgi:hypothetical protein
MIIYYVLCGNKYSEVLFKISKVNSGITLIHRSNVRKLAQKLFRVLILFAAIVLRYLIVPFFRGKFILVAPHVAGNYGFLSRIFKPHEYFIIDDGITFEYWCDFHDQYILPLCRSSKTTILIGPRCPNWNVELYANLKVLVINRKKITKAILENFISPVNFQRMILENEQSGWILDDGQMEVELLEKLLNRIQEQHNFDRINILWHPARHFQKGMNIPIQPAEVSVLCSNTKLNFVIGKASTVLFNIVAYDPNIPVASFPTGYNDLDQSAYEQGILKINIEDYVEI